LETICSCGTEIELEIIKEPNWYAGECSNCGKLYQGNEETGFEADD